MPHRRATQIVVPADTSGVEVVRAIPTMGHRGRGWTTHCEVRYTGVRVPVENTLGEEGDGFRIAQKRLGPGRIHHVMRWLGQMQRAFELMCAYSLERESFGGPARREADGAELDRRLGRRDPGLPADDPRRGAQDRPGRRGSGRGLADQVLRRARSPRRDRPRGADARRTRAHGRDAARRDALDGARRADLRRPGRGAPHGRRAPDPQVVRRRRAVALRASRSSQRRSSSGSRRPRRVARTSPPVELPLVAGPRSTGRRSRPPATSPAIRTAPSFNGGSGEGRPAGSWRRRTSSSGAGYAAVLAARRHPVRGRRVLRKFLASYDPSWGRVKAITSPFPGTTSTRPDGADGLLPLLRRCGRRSGEGLLQLRPRRLARRRPELELLRGRRLRAPARRRRVAARRPRGASSRACTLAYWHHPRFSSGEHGIGLDVRARSGRRCTTRTPTSSSSGTTTTTSASRRRTPTGARDRRARHPPVRRRHGRQEPARRSRSVGPNSEARDVVELRRARADARRGRIRLALPAGRRLVHRHGLAAATEPASAGRGRP